MTARETSSPGKIDWLRVRERKARQRGTTGNRPLTTEKAVTVRLVDTYHKVGEARGFAVESDEPEEVGGTNRAPQPTELMLMSLAFCQLSILVDCAAAMRIQLDDAEVAVRAWRDDRGLRGGAGIRPGFERIELETRLVSDEPQARLAKLAEIAEGRCPVFDNLTNPTAVRNRVLCGSDAVFERSSVDESAAAAP